MDRASRSSRLLDSAGRWNGKCFLSGPGAHRSLDREWGSGSGKANGCIGLGRRALECLHPIPALADGLRGMGARKSRPRLAIQLLACHPPPAERQALAASRACTHVVAARCRRQSTAAETAPPRLNFQDPDPCSHQLSRLWQNHRLRIAVIENELGEVGIDHELVISSDE